MASVFDPLKAAREELAGLNEVYRGLFSFSRERKAEEAMGKAESELNAIRKITGYARVTVSQLKQRITELEKQT
jgi:hypothetical protein